MHTDFEIAGRTEYPSRDKLFFFFLLCDVHPDKIIIRMEHKVSSALKKKKSVNEAQTHTRRTGTSLFHFH